MSPPHRVGVVTRPGTVLLDLAVPLQVFDAWPAQVTEDLRMACPYEVTMVGDSHTRFGPWIESGAVGPLEELVTADTVVVPGVIDPKPPVDPNLVAALAEAARRGARVVSICTGAFALAAAGLLDDKMATTHWYWADLLRQRHPRVHLRESELYVTDGNVSTSAGILAGTDLCLHLLRQDCGQEAANAMARFLVSPPHREGGQAQYIPSRRDETEHTLSRTMDWMLENLHQPLTLSTVAAHAHLSTRTLQRRFSALNGISVLEWVTTRRLERARELLETSELSVAQIAYTCGFGSHENLRLHFAEHVRTTPSAYRRTFATR